MCVISYKQENTINASVAKFIINLGMIVIFFILTRKLCIAHTTSVIYDNRAVKRMATAQKYG